MYGYYDYSYTSPGIGGAFANVGGFMMVFLLLFYLAMFAFWVATYVLYSLGIYTIAKRRGIHNPWLSWVPLGSEWILGSISDQYQYMAKGKVRNRRKVLLGLSISLFVMVFIMFVSAFAAIFGEATGTMEGELIFGAGVAILLLCYLVILVVGIILTVYMYMSLYDLYVSCDPSAAVLYLVLSIFVNVVQPFFVFGCRKKDLGISFHRTAPPAEPRALETAVSEPAAEPETQPEEPVAAE